MEEYVQVPVPRALVPTVIQLVADYLTEAGEGSTVHTDATTWAAIAEFGDEDGVAYYWWRWLRPAERDLMRLLAKAPRGSLEASVAARQLRMSPADLAGVLGPLNRRSRRDGYPMALASRQQIAEDGSGRRIKILSLAEGLAKLVEQYDTGEPPQEPKPAVRRRQRSTAAEKLRAHTEARQKEAGR